MAWLHSNRTKTVWPYDIIVIAFCAAILILALVVGSFRQVGNFDVETDFYWRYAIEAQNILAGRPYTDLLHRPGYAILLAGVSLLTGDLFVAGKIMSAFATALLGWTMYSLFKALFDAKIAFVSTLLCLFALIPYSFLAATDVVGALLMLLPLRILLNRSTVSLRCCLLTGICAAMAYLVRSNAVSVILGIGSCLLFIDFEREGFVRRLTNFGFFVGGAVLTLSPWLIINWKINGSPFASITHLQIGAHFYDPAGDGLETTLRQTALKFNSLSEVVLYDPARLFGKFLQEVFYENIKNLAVQGLRFPAYLFAGPGLLLMLRDLSRKRVAFLIVCLTGYLILGLTDFRLRFYFFLFPLLFASVAYLLFNKAVFPARGYTAVLQGFCVIVLAAFIGISSYNGIKRTMAYEPRYLLEIAEFLRRKSTPGELIIVRKSHLAYLAGLTRVFPLANTSEEYLVKAREIGARYIVYSRFEASLWPGLNSLRNPDAIAGGFKLIYTHNPTRTLIYEIQP